jgi:hypothetical protein
MNRSILIVICDFLLLSLLAFSTVDIKKVSDASTGQVKMELSATNQVDPGKDLAAVMKVALDEERKSREALLGELQRSRDTGGRTQTQLSERERQLQAYQQELLTREQQQKVLEQQIASAQTNLQSLSSRLESTSTDALMSKEKLAALEAELKKKAEQSSALERQVTQLARSNALVLSEKQKLSGQLQVAEVEKRHAVEQATRMQQEVKVEREEKAKLAEGVKALASRSGELTQEIRENRPLTANAVFNDFVTNRVQARFDAVRAGAFGLDSSRRRDTETVLVSDGTNIFALCHVQDTPLALWNPGVDWQQLSGMLGRNGKFVSIRSLSFYLRDPRMVMIPVTAAEARTLGGKIYRASSDPYKFQDAVLVGAREGYYGECRFEIDLSTPEYFKLDRSVLKGLFGKFNPSRGDLVFSKTGELLGVMANNSYCLMVRNFDAAAAFQFGPDVRGQHTGDILSQLYSMVAAMPLKLQ